AHQLRGELPVRQRLGVHVRELLLRREDLHDLLQHRHPVRTRGLCTEMVPGLGQLPHVRQPRRRTERHHEEVVQAVQRGGAEVVAAVGRVGVARQILHRPAAQ
ncbi:MAG: hypothetical protein ACK559_26585, partial [bacterium]